MNQRAKYHFLTSAGLRRTLLDGQIQIQLRMFLQSVFDWGFDMIPNGRFWQLIDTDVFNKLEKKYQLYKELYC